MYTTAILRKQSMLIVKKPINVASSYTLPSLFILVSNQQQQQQMQKLKSMILLKKC